MMRHPIPVVYIHRHLPSSTTLATTDCQRAQKKDLKQEAHLANPQSHDCLDSHGRKSDEKWLEGLDDCAGEDGIDRAFSQRAVEPQVVQGGHRRKCDQK